MKFLPFEIGIKRKPKKGMGEVWECLSDVLGRLDTVEKKVEATRQKVYREGKEAEVAAIIPESKPPAPSIYNFRPGDSVPDGF